MALLNLLACVRAVACLERDFWYRRPMLNTGILERLRSDYKSFRDLGVGPALYGRLARLTPEYRAAFTKDEPLVSICTVTYNRAQLLVERSLASSLGQTYRNVEVIVVGDGCTDDTEERLRQIGDPRLRFFNRPTRQEYPTDPEKRWMVAGADAVNQAYAMARGDFITPLDDDDMYTPDRIEKLVECAKRTHADLIHHPFAYENADGSWSTNPGRRFYLGSVTSASAFFHSWYKRFPVDPVSILRFMEPGDWNRMRRYRYVGAKIVRHPDVMLRHFRERTQYGR